MTATTLTLDQALTNYQVWRVSEDDASPKTLAGEKPGLLAFADTMHSRGHTMIDTIRREDVSAWWAGLHLAESTKATRLHQLRSFLRFCREQGWLAGDPSALISAPRPAPEPRERLTPAELLELIELGERHSRRDRACLALAANLGLRGGEISRLRVRDVNFSQQEIKVRVDKTREIDLMPITSDLATELANWLGVYPKVTADSFLVPAVYRHPDGHATVKDRPFTEPFKAVKRALTALGWDETRQEGIHTVRRSVARILFDDIESSESFDSALLATMALLHHKRAETTLTYIGRDRMTLARDRLLAGRPFLTRMVRTEPVVSLVVGS
jgi:integrase